ncbi:hypothetical protein L1O03_09770 [Corynebacterium uropygiale]|uniref:Uncharacterized protein n=1 Tax=Corynebacterium uropygiale TaxID=1775911 RepID=A0A9X1QQU8_9CORY|nr:hypothetical protein [Corynebacterium uropygiale]
MSERLEIGEGARGVRTLVGRACGLDASTLARLRNYDEYSVEVVLRTPFDVLASRRAHGRCIRDGAVVAARDLLEALSGPLSPTRTELEIGPAHDPSWPGSLPPREGFVLLDEIPADVVRRLSDEGRALARQFSGPLGPPASLLNQTVLTVEGKTPRSLPMRMIFACTSLGLVPGPGVPLSVPRHLRVSASGRWTRIDAPFGTVYHADQSALLMSIPATRSQ